MDCVRAGQDVTRRDRVDRGRGVGDRPPVADRHRGGVEGQLLGDGQINCMCPGGVGAGRDDRGRGHDHAQVSHATGARNLGLDVRVGVDDLVGRPRAQVGRVGGVVVAGRVVAIDQVLELGDRQLDLLTWCHGDGRVKQPGPGQCCRAVGVGRARHVVVDVLGGIDDRELPVRGTVGILDRGRRVL